MIKDKVLMITGGTGSFGNAVLKKFLNSDLKEIRIFSRDEKKQEDMRIEYKNDKLNFIVGDIRDSKTIDNAMIGVNYLFHAGALKQVPSCEFYPLEAVKTNYTIDDLSKTETIDRSLNPTHNSKNLCE
jgi:UDP-N-acetylglucosamine 4,6-dehydratase